MNDTTRNQWIDNDEGLYLAWVNSRISKRQFISTNRANITTTIEKTLSGKRQVHTRHLGWR